MGKASKNKNKNKPITIKPERNYFGWVIGAAAAVLAIVLVIVVVTLNNSTGTGEQATTTPKGVVNDGFVIDKNGLVETATAQKVDVTFKESTYDSNENNMSLFIDYSCPHCAEFEEASFPTVKQMLQDGQLDTVTLHPVAFLGTYSLLAGNALTCVAEYAPNDIISAHEILMANYASGFKKKEVVETFKDNNIGNADVDNCVKKGTYNTFITEATARASNGPIPASTIENITGTPTILVNGNRYPGNPQNTEDLKQFVFTQDLTNETEQKVETE